MQSPCDSSMTPRSNHATPLWLIPRTADVDNERPVSPAECFFSSRMTLKLTGSKMLGLAQGSSHTAKFTRSGRHLNEFLFCVVNFLPLSIIAELTWIPHGLASTGAMPRTGLSDRPFRFPQPGIQLYLQFQAKCLMSFGMTEPSSGCAVIPYSSTAHHIVRGADFLFKLTSLIALAMNFPLPCFKRKTLTMHMNLKVCLA